MSDGAESNPYEVLTPEDAMDVSSGSSGSGTAGFEVRGDLIACGPTVSLPECCIVSGVTSDLVRYERHILRRINPLWILLLLLMAPGWLAYGLIWIFGSKRCVASWSMSRAQRSIRRQLIVAGVVAAVVGCFVVFSNVENPKASISGIMLLSCGLGISLRYLSHPISIARHVGGKRFWLTIRSREALDAIQRMAEQSK